jgi:hypothetical protein
MDNAIIPLKISQLAKMVAQKKHIPISAALGYIYDSPFYEKLYDEKAKWWYLDTASLYQEVENARMKYSVMKSDNVITFITFCIERYAQKHHLSSLQSYALFRKYEADKYLINGFDVLHTQGEETILQDIEIYLKNHRNK